MRRKDIAAAISSLSGEYAAASEPELLASARAKLLSLVDRLGLAPAVLSTERIDPVRLRTDARLRGAIRAHVDLAFRSSVDQAELLATATRGIIRVAFHPQLSEFPVGVALALPAARLPRRCAELYADESVTLAGAPLLVVFALATNPASLGGGSTLIQALRGDCGQFTPRPRMIALSPLTGLRARVIQLVDDNSAWDQASAGLHDPAELRQQVRDALSAERIPSPMPEPLGGWLAEQASIFAHSTEYVVGGFHRRLGASLIGIAHNADPDDAGALWARALFDYRR